MRKEKSERERKTDRPTDKESEREGEGERERVLCEHFVAISPTSLKLNLLSKIKLPS